MKKINFPLKGLLIDLDGTLYKGRHMIPYADQWIRELKELGIPFIYVTNNSSRTPEAVAEHLQHMGIDASPDEVYTSAQASAQYIVEQRLGSKVYRIGEQGLDRALTEAGLTLCEEADSPDVVVQGIDRSFTYNKLQQAVTYILDGAQSILTNPDLLLPSDHGLSPGAGTIGAAIQAGSGVKPTVIGKPSSIIMNYALHKLGCEAGNTAVIGDNLFTDIGAGKAAGCQTFLVLTGVTTDSNIAELSAQAGYEADLVFTNLQALSVYIHQTIRQ